ncbi:MAG: HEAT repeat domain-containing protein [Nitrospirae bacterium]|nr:HEAT repeat domain-containing protein [Nitrospirota bacterium]
MASVGKTFTALVAAVLLFIFMLSGLSGRATAVQDGFDLLVENVKNGNKEERIAAIEKLAGMKDERSLTVLINEFNELYEDWRIRIRALDALAASGKSMVTVALVNGSYDSCPAIKWHAVAGLGGYANEKSIHALIDALDDSTMYIRETAIESLGRIRAREAVPYLGNALHDRNFAVRLKATVALGRIGDEQALLLLKWETQNEKDLFIKDEAAYILKK